MRLDAQASQPTTPTGLAQESPGHVRNGDVGNMAWQREMERAQSQAWFKSPLPGVAVAHSQAGIDAAADSQGSVVSIKPVAWIRRTPAAREAPSVQLSGAWRLTDRDGRHSGMEPVAPPAGHSDLDGGAAAARWPVDQHFRPLRLDLAPIASTVKPAPPTLPAPAGPVHESRAPAANARSVPAEPHASVRLHVEHTGRDAHVWLGIDPQARPKLQQLVSSLARWLADAGYRAASWTCNGRAIERADKTTGLQGLQPADRSAVSPSTQDQPSTTIVSTRKEFP